MLEIPCPVPDVMGLSSVPVVRLDTVNGPSAVRVSPDRYWLSRLILKPVEVYHRNTRLPSRSNRADWPQRPASQPSCCRNVPSKADSICMSGNVAAGGNSPHCAHTSANMDSGVAGKSICGAYWSVSKAIWS